MGDPQAGLKEWLGEQLKHRGVGSCAELARRLAVPLDAVTRMKNIDGAREGRRIEAHHVPIMADLFGRWPPGFEPMDTEDKADELLTKAGTARKKKGGGRAKKSTTLDSSKDLVVQNVAGPVTVIDKSNNTLGDAETIAGNAPDPDMSENAEELMALVLPAVDKVYRAMKRKASLAELGRVAIRKHASILAACQHPDEFKPALAIMEMRLRRELGDDEPHSEEKG